jgi:hypothetical protein
MNGKAIGLNNFSVYEKVAAPIRLSSFGFALKDEMSNVERAERA